MMKMTKRKLHSAVFVAAIAMAGAHGAVAQDNSLSDKIAAQPLQTALEKFAEQSGLQVVYESDIATNIKSAGVNKLVSYHEALNQLLADTGLTYEFVNERMVMVFRSDEEDQGDGKTEQDKSEQKDVDEEIIVTGSRIARTPSQLAANIIVLNSRDLLAFGETTLEGALQQLPQNILGVTPVGASVRGSGMSFNGALNITGASSINLRGLGSESTLVLIDGRRIGKSGVYGGISDITGIPLRSVDRVEIMLDGGSSIYGSDAVGGVVNVIMKKDFEGNEANYEYGASEMGGYEEHVFTVSGDRAWEGGRVNVTFEHFKRTNLDAGERPEKIGNSDRFTNPGRINAFLGAGLFRYQGEIFTINQLRESYTTGEIYELYRNDELETLQVFLPPNQDGTNLSQQDLIVLDELPVVPESGIGVSLIPKQVRSGLSVGFDQQLRLFGQEVTLYGDVYYSDRKTYAADGPFRLIGEMPADHPGNPLPGNEYDLYWELPGFADRHFQSDQKVIRWNLSLDGKIGDSWSWSMTAGQSRDTLDSLYINEAVRSDDDEYLQLLDDGLNILASDPLAANPPELLRRLVKEPRDTLAVNTENTADISANGSLFDLPGGDIHLAVGASWRQEGLVTGSRKSVSQGSGPDTREIGTVSLSSIPILGHDDMEVGRTQRSAFAELLVPVVGSNNALPGMQSLNLTGSARYDSYHEQGSGSTWSLGMIWSPIDQVEVKVKRSTSYVVPTFRDQLVPVNSFEYTDYYPGGFPQLMFDINGIPTGEFDFLGLNIRGGNPDLKPETASIQSAGIRILPDALPGFSLSATWRDTEYSNRIGSPPFIAEWLRVPGVGRGFIVGSGYDTKYGSTLYRREDGLLVYDTRVTNTALVETAGIDYQASYNLETDYGQFIVSANVNHTTKYNTAKNLGDELVNQVGSVGFESRSVIPAYGYNTQVQWIHRGLFVSLNASTSSSTRSLGVHNERLDDGRGGDVILRITKPALNMALVMSYDFDEGDLFSAPDWLQGSVVSLKIPGLLDDTTEYRVIDATTGEPYRLAELNANSAYPVDRTFHISLTKRF